MALRIVRTACLLVAGGVVMVGCSSPIPAPAAATPTPGLGDALRQELGTLQTCLEASTTALSEANAVCYQGFSYTLDGYTWPSSVGQREAALRADGLTLATCLSGTSASTCSSDLATFNTDRDQLLSSVP
jgi:hypothetical protein